MEVKETKNVNFIPPFCSCIRLELELTLNLDILSSRFNVREVAEFGYSHSFPSIASSSNSAPHFQPPKPKPKPPDPTPNRNPTPIKLSLPFDFRHSYSETDPTLEPIGFREPKRFSPFGPGRLDREWTGTSAPVRDELDSCLVE
ncbi:hypothetical protein ERO13_D05G368068v2 [Gossypium hirsutum]|nr:hypothetical protein ERO13_D05G368068v2 [Gossypium hirsutum]